MATSFAFTPLEGMATLCGPVRAITQFEAVLAEKFGRFIEGIPRKLRCERFTADGAIVERDRFDPDGSLAERAVYDYSADKRLDRRRHYDGAGQAIAVYRYVYDARGRPVELAGFDADGTRLRRVVRHYGRDGRLDGMIETRGTRETRWSVSRGSNGAITASVGQVLEDGRPLGRIEIRYDAFGNPRSGHRLSMGGLTESQWRYAYDHGRDRGNWTRRTLETGVEKFGQHFYEPSKVLMRQFHYFD